MKFLIEGNPNQIERMKKDLDKEIKIAEKALKSKRFKAASKMIEKVIKVPVLFVLDYRQTSRTTIELITAVTGGDRIQKKVTKEITENAKTYGKNVTVSIL